MQLDFRAASLALLLIASTPVLAVDKVLVYTRNFTKDGKGFVHDNIAACVKAIRELGAANQFEADVAEDPAVFGAANLKQYRALVFANSNNEAFASEEQRAAFKEYIQGGGGFVGIHSSTGTERDWPYFQQVQGAKFLRHPPLQKFTIKVLDATHPATAHLGKTWEWSDECYFFTNLNPGIKVLLALDTTVPLKDPAAQTQPGGRLNGEFPLAWCQQVDGGRAFYTALGHKIEYYADPTLRQHLLGGIRWAMGTTTQP
ncbi:MAG: ThuA domain-containing protein [Verrucomicrobia bacterium]|nr:ThuA domain-containing protein [Verrucomicrobiota bacterium]